MRFVSQALLCCSNNYAELGPGAECSHGWSRTLQSKMRRVPRSRRAGKTPMGQKLNVRDLHSAEVQKQSDAELPQMIAQGKGKMPAFSKTLSADQIKLLVAHIRELGKK
jgi:hypothetical protein